MKQMIMWQYNNYKQIKTKTKWNNQTVKQE
jgi:hypothetical protein